MEDIPHQHTQYSVLTLGQWLKVEKKTPKKQRETHTCKSIETQFLSAYASWWSRRWVGERNEQSHPAVLLLLAMCLCVCVCRCVCYLVCMCAWKPFLRQQLRRCSRTRCYHSFWFRITAWRMGPRGPASVAARLLPQLLSGSWFSLNRLFHKEKTPALSPLLCSPLQQTATLIE